MKKQPNPQTLLQQLYSAETLKTKYQIKPTKKPHPLPPLVTILWEDAKAIGTEWETNTQTHNHTPEPTATTGWIWKQTKTHTTIVTLINSTHIGGGTLIPNGCITHTIHHTP
jgi:hypothetical protein